MAATFPVGSIQYSTCSHSIYIAILACIYVAQHQQFSRQQTMPLRIARHAGRLGEFMGGVLQWKGQDSGTIIGIPVVISARIR